MLAEAGYLPAALPVPTGPAAVETDGSPSVESDGSPSVGTDGSPSVGTDGSPSVTPDPSTDAQNTATAGPEEPSPPVPGLLSGVGLMRDGVPFGFVLGVPEDDDTALAVARTAADLLVDAGVAATVRELPPDGLYGEALVEGTVHAVVGWMHVGDDPATTAMSRFGCPPAVPADPDGAGGAGVPTTGSAPTPDTAPPTATGDADDEPDDDSGRDEVDDALAQLEAPSNLSGACDPTLQPDLEAALRGDVDAVEVLTAAQPRLWDLAVNLPLVQGRAVVAAGPDVEGVSLVGAVSAGIVADAHIWQRRTP